jgi:peptidyl-prolyl cis-trans isomerase B (cyclophilin B)
VSFAAFHVCGSRSDAAFFQWLQSVRRGLWGNVPSRIFARDFANCSWKIFRPMKAFVSIFAAALVLGAVSVKAEDSKTNNADSAKKPEVQTASKEDKSAATNEVAVIKTSEGEMVVAFWPDVAPKTVENFKKLAKEGFYNGTAFHRIIRDFMIQGGDPNTKDKSKEAEYGQGGPGYSIKAEFNDRKHETGVISMARSNDPDSAGSQFFICHAPASSPGMQYLNGKYTAFGKLIKGEDVLDKIANTPVGPSAMGERSKPLKRVEIESIKIVPANSIK